MAIVAAQWGQMSRFQQTSSGALIASALILAIGAVGLALQSRQVWGKVLLGIGAGGVALSLAGCCWRPALAPAQVQANPPAPQDGGQVVDADAWLRALGRRRLFDAATMERELTEAMAECHAREPRNDPQFLTFVSEIGEGIARRYLLAYPTAEEAQWHFLNHVVADAEMRRLFIHNAHALPYEAWTALLILPGWVQGPMNGARRTNLVRQRLTTLQKLLSREGWRQNPDLMSLRSRVSSDSLFILLRSWMGAECDSGTQCEIARGLREIIELASPSLWPEAGAPFGNAPGDRLLGELVVPSHGLIQTLIQEGRTREQAVLHQADCLATLIRAVHEDGTLPRAAIALAGLGQAWVDFYRQHQEPTMARIDQGETGLLAQIAAVQQAAP